MLQYILFAYKLHLKKNEQNDRVCFFQFWSDGNFTARKSLISENKNKLVINFRCLQLSLVCRCAKKRQYAVLNIIIVKQLSQNLFEFVHSETIHVVIKAEKVNMYARVCFESCGLLPTASQKKNRRNVWVNPTRNMLNEFFLCCRLIPFNIIYESKCSVAQGEHSFYRLLHFYDVLLQKQSATFITAHIDTMRIPKRNGKLLMRTLRWRETVKECVWVKERWIYLVFAKTYFHDANMATALRIIFCVALLHRHQAMLRFFGGTTQTAKEKNTNRWYLAIHTRCYWSRTDEHPLQAILRINVVKCCLTLNCRTIFFSLLTTCTCATATSNIDLCIWNIRKKTESGSFRDGKTICRSLFDCKKKIYWAHRSPFKFTHTHTKHTTCAHRMHDQ